MYPAVDKRAAAFFAAANLLAGLIHYAFQVWSSRRLSAVEFGELNSWIAYLSVALSCAAFAQYLANFHVARRSRLSVLAIAGVGLGAATPLLPFVLADAAGLVPIAVVGFFCAVAFSWFIGQAQARLMFYLMGAALLLAAAGKFGLALVPFPVERVILSLAWAVSLSYAVALLALCLALLVSAPDSPTSASPPLGLGLLAPGILAAATVLVPQLDIIVIHQTQTPEVIGQFARVSILYKVVFFSFLVLAQWILPHQLQDYRSRMDGRAPGRDGFHPLRPRARGAMLLLSLALAGAVYLGGRLAMTWMWGGGFSELRVWVLLSVLNMALLTNIFFRIQVDCAYRQPWAALGALLGLLAELGLALGLRLSVARYLEFAIAFNAALWLAQDLVRLHPGEGRQISWGRRGP